jgi:TolA-binding protein
MMFALLLGGGPLLAASREQRDFDAANGAFQDGLWNRAETEFDQFIQRYPKSPHLPEAVLMQAQAEYKQKKFAVAIALLQAQEPSAGVLADQYIYWIGQSEFTAGNYTDAVDTFTRLANTFTNSPWRLDGVVNEAAANARLGRWPQVSTLLQTSTVFQDAAKTNAADSRVLNGRLLQAQAFLALNHPGSATAVLQTSKAFESDPQLDWQRLYLLSRSQLEDGNTNEALTLTTNLVEAATRANNADLAAKSVAERAGILENSGKLPDAISAYEVNLANNAPGDSLQQAVLKIADLSVAQKNFSAAEDALQNYQSRFPSSPQADLVLLTLGELHLKGYVARPSSTNTDLQLAHASFDQFIDTFTNSAFLGNAYLDRGWCFWLEQNWPESAADFQSASDLLPASVDLAIARFKLGDAAYQLTNYTSALQNYRSVVNDFTNFPVVGESLGAQALYQSLRVCLELKDFAGASNSLASILKIYPVSGVAEKSILLVGEGLSDMGQPLNARALFQKFAEEFPASSLMPDVELAIARTYEQDNDWPHAITIYDSWVNRFAVNPKLPAVQYARAWANFQGGRETNAFMLFTNFLAEYPSNAVLTPVAQWWLGDYYYGRGDWVNAEANYEMVFQDWPASGLAYPAMLMAGRAAMGRQGYKDARAYFVNLAGDSNCPPQLSADAWFALGDVYMQWPSADPNNPLTNYWQAVPYFMAICQQYPGSEQAALAYGEIGNCYYQLGGQATNYYSDATNAYEQVIASPTAEIAARSQAQLGVGMVYEKLAALYPANQTALLQAALDNYLDVFFKRNVRDGETYDPFWVKEAGLKALPLMETLGAGEPDKFIDQMETWFPQMRDTLEKKRLEIPRPKST